MHDNHSLLEARARRTLIERIRPAEREVISDLRLSAWHITDPGRAVGAGEPRSRTEGLSASYEPFSIGQQWGPAWGTTWFKVETDIPAHDCDDLYELHVDLGWEDHSPGFQAEGLVLTADGTVIKAINPRNTWIPIPRDHSGPLTLFIEAAANPLLLGVPPFQRTDDGDILTSSPAPLFTLRAAQLVRIHTAVRALSFDIEIASELARTFPDTDEERLRLDLAVNAAIDALDLDDIPRTAAQAREILAPALSRPALPGAHHLVAVGHAHIDSAWLWPLRETRRKVVRTIANVLRLLDDGHEMIFALPAAQHVAWLEEDAPDVFERLKHWVAEGRVVPVGGMWVEPDALLPGGEAMCRQLLYGQRYFEEKLGASCAGIWLPDSFGYSAALPQIGVLGGARWFLTQKISWNQTDVFPHHTLWWEGIDGTRIFTHFPPVDTYGAEITAHQVRHAATNFKDKAKASMSLLPYGYGDGGGGPTRDMLERASRLSNLQGAPTLSHETPDVFFERALEEYPDAPVWTGELYLELHRATSTTQAETKLGNRRSESLLREAETWLATAAHAGLLDYPYEELEALWRDTLLAQFHDILPGTSIAWVYRDIEQMHAHVIKRAGELSEQARQAIADAMREELSFNASPYAQDGVPALGFAPCLGQVGSMIADAASAAPSQKVRCVPDEDGYVLSNGNLTVRITSQGQVSSLIGPDGRETVAPGEGLGQLWLYQDFPNMWDAWDVDEFYRATGRMLEATRVSADEASVCVTWEWGSSRVCLAYRLHEDGRALEVQMDADWQENEKLLKWRLPLDVHTDHALYETHMGHHSRPIHDNTTWESNKFEVSTHRWIHVGEPGWGVGVTNSATYGWSHARLARPGGGTYAVLEASLLRAPVFPDPYADRGQHTRVFHIVPAASLEDTRCDAYALHLPLRHSSPAQLRAGEDKPAATIAPIVSEVSGVVVESIKLAEDRSGDLIIRAYEPTGTRTTATLTIPGLRHAWAVDVLERVPEDIDLPELSCDGQMVTAHLGPFQILTIRAKAQ